MKTFFAAVFFYALLVGCGSTFPTQEVAAQNDSLLSESPGGFVRFGPHYYPFSSFVYEEREETSSVGSTSLIARLGTSDNYLIVPLLDGRPTTDVQLVYEKSISAVKNIRFEWIGRESVRIYGRLATGVLLRATLNSSAGTSTFRLHNNLAFLNGELGSGTYLQVEYLIAAHPEIDTLVFENVPGSLNDDINVYTGRLIREAGFHTTVASNGLIASGGVALFCAGVTRTLEPGARVGVHAWSIPGQDIDPAILPPNHHAHRAQLQYFREMLDLGEEFYFFTLHAAPFANVLWMTDAQIAKYGLASASSLLPAEEF
jgi:hypothetical protein